MRRMLLALAFLLALPAQAFQGMMPGPGISRAMAGVPGLMIYFDIAAKINGNEGNLFGGDGWTLTESQTQLVADEAFTLSNLRLQATTSTGVFHVITRIDEGAGSLDATRSGAGSVEASGTQAVAINERFNLAYTSVAVNTIFGHIAANVTFANSTGNYHGVSNFGGGTFNGNGVTRYQGISGALVPQGITVEAQAQWKNRAYTSLEGVWLGFVSNARTTNTVYTFLINGKDTACTYTLAPAETGANIAMTGCTGIALAAGDLLSMRMVAGASAENLVHRSIIYKLKSTTRQTETVASVLGFTRPETTTAAYIQIGGRPSTYITSVLTEAQVAIAPRFAASVHNLRCYLGANAYGDSFTLNLIKNGDTGSPAISYTIASGTANQWIGDTSSAVTIADTDTLSIEIDGPGTSIGTMALYSCGLTFSPL